MGIEVKTHSPVAWWSNLAGMVILPAVILVFFVLSWARRRPKP
jgi:hypothetical protein